MAKNSGGRPTYYLDANALIEYIEGPLDVEPASTVVALFEAGDRNAVDLVTSVVTIAEVFMAKHELDAKLLDPEVSRRIEYLWHPEGSPLRVVEVSELVAREANALLRQGVTQGWSKSRGADGIHFATAAREHADEFFTSEKSANKWGSLLGFKVCRAHRPPAPPDSPPKSPPALPPTPELFDPLPASPTPPDDRVPKPGPAEAVLVPPAEPVTSGPVPSDPAVGNAAGQLLAPPVAAELSTPSDAQPPASGGDLVATVTAVEQSPAPAPAEAETVPTSAARGTGVVQEGARSPDVIAPGRESDGRGDAVKLVDHGQRPLAKAKRRPAGGKARPPSKSVSPEHGTALPDGK